MYFQLENLLKVHIFISDNKLSALGLQRSKFFLGGTIHDYPQIVFPILDLIGKDPKWSKSKLTMDSLLRNSLEVNSKLKHSLHQSFTQNQDIVKTLQDYYSWFNLSFQEFTQNENLLLEILSNYLERKITFHPILKPFYHEEISKFWTIQLFSNKYFHFGNGSNYKLSSLS